MNRNRFKFFSGLLAVLVLSLLAVSAVRLIKSYCREEYFQGQFGQIAALYLHHNLGLARLRGLIIPVMAAATGAGTGCLLSDHRCN